MNTITIKGEPLRKESVAAEAITPGYLVEPASATTCQKHSTDGGPAIAAFALENDLVGDAISDAYDSGDTVQIGYFRTGEEVYAYLTTNQTIAAGDYLMSAGTGLLKEFDPSVETSSSSADVYRNCIVARALEAVTTTSAAARIKVEVL